MDKSPHLEHCMMFPAILHHEQQAKLESQLSAFMMSYINPASFLPHAVVMSTLQTTHPAYIQPVHLSFEGLHDPINILEGLDVNSTMFKSFTQCHPPATKHKSSFVSVSTCLALHVPRSFVTLCAHLFKSPPFLSPSLSVFFSIPPLPFHFPTGNLFFFSGGIWDPIHWEHIVRLLSTAAFGPREAEWVTVGAFVSSSLSLSAPISHQLTPCFLPCDDVMAFICCGVPIDSLSLLPTPHTSHFYPAFLQSPILYLLFSSFPDFFTSPKALGVFVDAWMLFCTPTEHV